MTISLTKSQTILIKNSLNMMRSYLKELNMNNDKLLSQMVLRHYWSGSLSPRDGTPMVFVREWASLADADDDGICGNEDECPYDSDNDIDGDGLCCSTTEIVDSYLYYFHLLVGHPLSLSLYWDFLGFLL